MIVAGDRLRDLREDKWKTQAEISSLLGTTQQIYSRYETNRTDLPLRHLIKLADYYQVSADYILGRTSYPKNPPEMAKPFLKNVTYGEVNGRISSFQTSTKKQLIEYINYLVYLESRHKKDWSRWKRDIDTIDVQKTAPGIAHMQRLGLSFIFQTFV